MTVLVPRDKRRSRYLFDWSARWALERNLLDAITGQAATLTRTSIGSAISSDGRVQLAAHTQPRFQWVDLDGDGVRETPTLLLEDARTNLVIQSDALATGWTLDVGGTITNAVGTYVGRPFSRVVISGGGDLYRAVTFTGNAAKAYSALFKQDGTAAGTIVFGIWDSTASAFAGRTTVTIAANGTMTAVANTGTLLATEALGDGVYRVSAQTTSVTAAHSMTFEIDPGTAASALVSGCQAEDGLFSSSLLPTTTGTVARVADNLVFPFNAPPQPLTMYAKIAEGGTALANGVVAYVGDAGASDPFFTIIGAGGGVYAARNSSVLSTAAAGPAVGNTVEGRAVFFADGSVQFGQSINGAAEVVAAASGAHAFGSAFVAPTLYFNSFGTSGVGFSSFVAVRVAAGARTLAFMREG